MAVKVAKFEVFSTESFETAAGPYLHVLHARFGDTISITNGILSHVSPRKATEMVFYFSTKEI